MVSVRILDLKSEIDADPLARGYSGMTNQQIADDLNVIARDNWVDISGGQFAEAVVQGDFSGLTAGEQTYVSGLFGCDSIATAPGSNIRAAVINIFGNPSATLTNLIAVANQQVSRGSELGIGNVTEHDVQIAKGIA